MTNLAWPIRPQGEQANNGNNSNEGSLFSMEKMPALQSKQNVVYGMNYSIPAVDAFVSSSATPASRKRNPVGPTPASATSSSTIQPSSSHDEADSGNNSSSNDLKKSTPQADATRTSSSVKRSKRGRKSRVITTTKTPVRYLVSEVPQVAKNRTFLQEWNHGKENLVPDRLAAPILAETGGEESSSSSSSLSRASSDTDQGDERSANGENSPEDSTRQDASMEADNNQVYPFGDTNSVVWIPPERSYWEDSLGEMVAICTSAALRRHDSSKPFYAPLSRDYIRDRVDIDDPLYGYQIRHRSGGWLQGFILFTNFTTWSHYFRFDSLHEASGVPALRDVPERRIDSDGSLGNELEAQPRSGDPLSNGVVFPSIAEISLVGGLGCGEYLLRMAIDDILSKGTYKFVVLQATDTSRGFYEKFGFTRVGAISKYGEQKVTNRIIRDPGSAALSDLVGYRHWTYAHESERSLGKHGGPSYMMALRLEPLSSDKTTRRASFLEAMKPAIVDAKPHVKIIGTPTPGSTRKRTIPSFGSPFAPPNLVNVPESSQQKRRKSSNVLIHNKKVTPKAEQKKSRYETIPTPPPVPAYRTPTTDPAAAKRNSAVITSQRRYKSASKGAVRYGPLGAGAMAARKPGMTLEEQRDLLMAPPKYGKPLSYNQKQYQSIWLAVPPPKPAAPQRKPPRERAVAVPSLTAGRKRKRDSFSLFADSEATLLGAANEIDYLSEPIRLKFQITRKAKDPLPKEQEQATECSIVSQQQRERAERHARAEARRMAKPIVTAPSASRPSSKSSSNSNNSKRSIRKQRMISIPKTIPRERQLYNKVVRPKGSTEPGDYNFVLHYDHGKDSLRMIRLIVVGELSGKRTGRPRYKALVDDDSLFSKSDNASAYEIVPAYMVTKTPHVEMETWDILE